MVRAMPPITAKLTCYFNFRKCEHLEISTIIAKIVTGNEDSAFKRYLLFCNHLPNFDRFSILATNNNDFKITLIKSLLFSRDDFPLCKNKQSLPWNS